MREIVQMGIGQFGVNVAYESCCQLLSEHQLSPEGFREQKVEINNEKINVHFEEVRQNQYVPRTLLIDLDPGSINQLNQKKYFKAFSPDYQIQGKQSANNNWGLGHYEDGTPSGAYIDQIMDKVRRRIENCDCFQGFQYIFSMSGGTGSGLGTLIVSKVREEYPDRIFSSYNLYPFEEYQDNVLASYNSILSLHQLVENSDLCYIMDNKALFKLTENELQLETPKYENVNRKIAILMSSMTSSIRFPGYLNADLRKQASNLVMFPRLHFFNVSIGPQSDLITLQDAVNDLHQSKNLFSTTEQNKERSFIASFIQFCGQEISSSEVERFIETMKQTNSTHYIDWIKNNYLVSMCKWNRVDNNTNYSLAGVFSSTTLGNYFKQLTTKYAQQFRRKAHIYHYTKQGMDEMEFIEAESNSNDIISEYQQYSQELIGEGEMEEEEEE